MLSGMLYYASTHAGKEGHGCKYIGEPPAHSPDRSTPAPLHSHPPNGHAHSTSRPRFCMIAHSFIIDCYCGERANYGDKDDHKCDVGCVGPSPYSCGGQGWIVMYDIPKGDTPLPEPGPSIKPAVGGMELRGCYPLAKNNGYSLTLADFPNWDGMDNEVGVDVFHELDFLH